MVKKEIPVVPTDDVLKLRELQVEQLTLNNQLFQIQAQANELVARRDSVSKQLSDLFNKAQEAGKNTYSLDARTLKFTARRKK